MKHCLKLVLAAAVTLSSLLPALAHADSITFSLAKPTQTVAPGGTVTFIATVTAPGSNTGTLYLNGDNIDYFGPGTVDDSSFYNTFFLNTFTPGTTETDNLFSIILPANATLGMYGGNVQVYGGSDQFAMNLLGTANFTVNVAAAPPPPAVAPEPGTLLLVSTGLLSVAGAGKRRYLATMDRRSGRSDSSVVFHG